MLYLLYQSWVSAFSCRDEWKAVELLSQDKDGFFLMVEGNQIDGATHANDPIYAVTEFLAFDEAIKLQLTLLKKKGIPLSCLAGS